jgi:hypothetical protein
MSEFTKLFKAIEADGVKLSSLSTAFTTLKESNRPSSSSAYHELLALVTQIESLLKEIESNSKNINDKFMKKLTWTDPVTGAARFGDNMRQKITVAAGVADALLVECQFLFNAVGQACGEEKVIWEAMEEQRCLAEDEERRRLALEAAGNNEAAIAADRELQAQLEEKKRIEALHREAEVARLRKRLKQHFKSEVENIICIFALKYILYYVLCTVVLSLYTMPMYFMPH